MLATLIFDGSHPDFEDYPFGNNYAKFHAFSTICTKGSPYRYTTGAIIFLEEVKRRSPWAEHFLTLAHFSLLQECLLCLLQILFGEGVESEKVQVSVVLIYTKFW